MTASTTSPLKIAPWPAARCRCTPGFRGRARTKAPADVAVRRPPTTASTSLPNGTSMPRSRMPRSRSPGRCMSQPSVASTGDSEFPVGRFHRWRRCPQGGTECPRNERFTDGRCQHHADPQRRRVHHGACITARASRRVHHGARLRQRSANGRGRTQKRVRPHGFRTAPPHSRHGPLRALPHADDLGGVAVGARSKTKHVHAAR